MEVAALNCAYKCVHRNNKYFNGILSNIPIAVGSVVEIDGNFHTVKKARIIEFSLFIRTAKITISCYPVYLSSPVRVKRFLLSVGFDKQIDFTHAFYQKPIIRESRALITLYYVCFEDIEYF
jgi:hypothetical protein